MTAWLCLAVTLLTGVTPVNGLVLCLEPDGRVSVEVANNAPVCRSCCEQHPDEPTPASPTAQESDGACCPCLDLPVPGSTQEHRVQPRLVEFQLGPWTSTTSPLESHSFAVAACPFRAPPREVPRPPESIALISTVVLLR